MLRKVAVLIRETLREIFDESAYARFLARNKAIASRESYTAFTRESAAARQRRPKCC
jgi:hypothetical protein